MNGRAPANGDREPRSKPLEDLGGSPLRDAEERAALLRGMARTLLTGTGLVVLYYLLPLNRHFRGWTVLVLFAGLGAGGVLVGWQVRAILRSRHPALRAIEAVAVSIPLFLLLFAATYFMMGNTDPRAFSEPLTRTDCIYFVVTVFATVGFGDIAPVSEPARVLTTVQMLGDLVLIGLVLKLFLNAVDRGRRRADRGWTDR